MSINFRYIHGGAWRDPTVSSTSFEPALSLLLQSPEVIHIAGFASINYRLSPYPSHPTDPSANNDAARNAKHPDHINDVLDALRYLQEVYKFGQRYLLVGHSAGATLAYQVAMDLWRPENNTPLALPIGVVGLAGIYDFTGLQARHPGVPIYGEILRNAFGPDWDHASPKYRLRNDGNLENMWVNGKLAVVAQSDGDGLVENEQALEMLDALSAREVGSPKRRTELIWLKEHHDDLWWQGTELAKVIREAVCWLLEQ